MRIVVALGGNALLRRGQPMTAENQRENVRVAAKALAPIAEQHELVISHGNGPQVGLLALQGAAYEEVETYPLDVLGAQTEGMIGYLIEQELGNLLPFEKPLATILTMVEVDPDDPASPTRRSSSARSTRARRPSSSPRRRAGRSSPTATSGAGSSRRPSRKRIFEIRPITWLLERGSVVICTGGGGIPTMYQPGTRTLVGAEVVIDKDRASALLARELGADLFVMATDVDAVYADWGTPSQRAIGHGAGERAGRVRLRGGLHGPEGRGRGRLRRTHRKAGGDRHARRRRRARGRHEGDERRARLIAQRGPGSGREGR